MRRLAAFARKVGERVARRFGATSASEGPLPCGVGKLKVPAGTLKGKVAPLPASLKPLPGAVGRLGELKEPTETTARRSSRGTRVPASQEPRSRAASSSMPPLPPPTRKASEGKVKAKVGVTSECEPFATKMARVAALLKATKTRRLEDGFPPSTGSAAPSSTTTPPPPPPPPHADSFWYKVMMAGGASIAFLMDFLKGHVEKEVDLRMKERDIQEKAKIILEKDKDLELTKKELEIATKEQKQRRWFWP